MCAAHFNSLSLPRLSDLETCSKILKGIRGGELTVIRISKSGTPGYFRSGRQKFSSNTQHESCTSRTATTAQSCTVQIWSCSVLFPQQWHSCAHIWKCDPLQQAAAVGCRCDTGRHHHSGNKTRLTVMCGCPAGKKKDEWKLGGEEAPLSFHVALGLDGFYPLVWVWEIRFITEYVCVVSGPFKFIAVLQIYNQCFDISKRNRGP